MDFAQKGVDQSWYPSSHNHVSVENGGLENDFSLVSFRGPFCTKPWLWEEGYTIQKPTVGELLVRFRFSNYCLGKDRVDLNYTCIDWIYPQPVASWVGWADPRYTILFATFSWQTIRESHIIPCTRVVYIYIHMCTVYMHSLKLTLSPPKIGRAPKGN